MKSLRIAINAQLRPGSGNGGVESVLRVLTGLSQLDGPEHYLFVALHAHQDWLRSLLRGTNASVVAPRRSIGRRLLRIVRGDTNAVGRYLDSLECDVVHFPYQQFHRTIAPSVFNPHDLQHRHSPQFFSAAELQSREATYGPACHAAHTVVAASQWVKRDLVEFLALDPSKIRVIPWAPLPIETAPSPSDRESFALYPA
ncbi:MAG TPA: glycosyltransferase, partial [Thermoanaerobaculia bacterium]